MATPQQADPARKDAEQLGDLADRFIESQCRVGLLPWL